MLKKAFDKMPPQTFFAWNTQHHNLQVHGRRRGYAGASGVAFRRDADKGDGTLQLSPSTTSNGASLGKGKVPSPTPLCQEISVLGINHIFLPFLFF